jgi:hypothetical protein
MVEVDSARCDTLAHTCHAHREREREREERGRTAEESKSGYACK